MSEKLFDHIENRIREAAENSVPPFNAQAWEKMEAKLDKEKDNRRRYFAFWMLALFLTLFVGAGSLFFFTTNRDNQHKENAGITQPKKSTGNIDKQKHTTTGSLSITDALKISNKINYNRVPVLHINSNRHNQKIAATDNHQPATAAISNNKQSSYHKTFKDKTFAKVSSSEATIVNSADVVIENDPTKVVGKPAGVVVVENTPANTSQNKVATEIKIEKNKPGKGTKVTGKKQLQQNNSSRLYFVGNIGADIAGVKFLSFQNNTVTPKYGAGIGFQLNKKLSLQTGFYAVRKKYIAGPADYKTKTGTYLGTVKLIKVDASCLVYEIPLSVRYNILEKKTFLFYATSGISSFIMKKEDYDYHYLSNNMYYQSTWSYTGNKNFLSILTLSAGIEKKISPTFSIIAEPSISVPLAGVGDGKVKLYSTALQAGLKYQPLKKMHKQKLRD